jgi:AraC-like DNA-binding protein
MIDTPEVLLETPSLDVLSDLLRAVRVSGAILLRGELSAPWAVQNAAARPARAPADAGARRLAILHVVTHGHCWIEVAAGERVALSAGTLAVLPYADVHTLGSGAEPDPVPITTLARAAPAHGGVPRVVHGGGGALTRMICGVLHCDELLFNPMLKTLPRLLVVRTPPEIEGSLLASGIHQLSGEAELARAGSGCLQARLAELLFIEVLRGHVASLPPGAAGSLGAVNDPIVGGALQHLHARPRERWTVTSLARHVGTSRSLLADRFARLVGEPPMRYLTRWRLQLAAQLLRDGHAGLAAIADQVGYESEAAFKSRIPAPRGRATRRLARQDQHDGARRDDRYGLGWIVSSPVERKVTA